MPKFYQNLSHMLNKSLSKTQLLDLLLLKLKTLKMPEDISSFMNTSVLLPQED